MDGFKHVETLNELDWSKVGTRFHGGCCMTDSTLARLAEVFLLVTDPQKARGIRPPFQGMVALIFLVLLAARITEMAVLVRSATD